MSIFCSPFALKALNHTMVQLLLDSPLDYEQVTRYNLDVRATDQGVPTLYGRSKIAVNVLDENDNYPIANQAMYRCV